MNKNIIFNWDRKNKKIYLNRIDNLLESVSEKVNR